MMSLKYDDEELSFFSVDSGADNFLFSSCFVCADKDERLIRAFFCFKMLSFVGWVNVVEVRVPDMAYLLHTHDILYATEAKQQSGTRQKQVGKECLTEECFLGYENESSEE